MNLDTVPRQITKLMSRFITPALTKAKVALDYPIQYFYPEYTIELPADHLLPVYQKAHPHYDRFLPHLVKYLKPSDLVIDVGANCGDSVAAMYSANPSLNYVCIEPDKTFYDYLLKNIQKMGATTIKTVQCLVGKSISGVTLAGSGGTKDARTVSEADLASVPNSNANSSSSILASSSTPIHHSRTLDDIMSSYFQSFEAPLRLIKSDVDGFDYDVINSGEALIQKDKPILFFECYYVNTDQKQGYFEMLEGLKKQDYQDYWIFDNFGELILHTHELEPIFSLMDYVWRQKSGISTRTIDYFDILCCTNSDQEFITQVVKEYEQVVLYQGKKTQGNR